MSSRADTEIEAKLAVVAPDPAGALAVLAGLPGLGGGFRLVPRPTLQIHDTYLQLPDAHVHEGPGGALALRQRRVREVVDDASPLGLGLERRFLTLKGSSRGGGDDSGVTRRLEIEVSDDEAGWQRVRRALRSAGIPVDEDRGALGLLQLRETERIRRNVVREGGERPVAEVALDTVTLTVPGDALALGGGRDGGPDKGRRLRFREVEVEALEGGPDGVRVVVEIRDALQQVTLPGGATLVPWPLSKLETGFELESLALSGGLPGEGPHAAVTPAGDLLPEGYRKIQEKLG